MIKRYLEPLVLEALTDTPVVLLNGARQVGKSTLVQHIASQTDAAYFTLDDATVLAAASGDPENFIAGLPERVILDEIQRVPELFLAIKAAVDQNRSPGRFLLTGSANVLMLPRLADSLAGRMEILTLWPLSQSEIEGSQTKFIDSAFGDFRPRPMSVQSTDDLNARLLAGGYPEALERPNHKRRRAWFNAYITTILQRDIQELAKIEGLNELPRLLNLLAARNASLLNYAAIARDVGLPQTTLKRYLSLLDATFLTYNLPAFSVNLGKRLVKSPKIFLRDTALSASLMGVDSARLDNDRQLFGKLFESWVVTELAEQSSWSDIAPKLFHYRTQTGSEVDLVLEDAASRLVGIEVKASRSASAKDFRGLKTLAEDLPDRFQRGFVIYTGDKVVPFGEKLFALPVSYLWQ